MTVARTPRFSARRAVAVGAGRLAALASRRLGRGGGTALPGIVAARLLPTISADLAAQLRRGNFLVSGTNGKTTTSRILATILDRAGYQSIRNESGSNMLRGVATALVEHATILGNIPDRGHTVGVFEVDEAALPNLLPALDPQAVLLLNLFRDQLDRYGEVATVARLWSDALSHAGRVTIVANADDPLLAATLAESAPTTSFFGVEPDGQHEALIEHAGDVKSCPRCGGRIAYSAVSLGHLGIYACATCGFHRPEPDLVARAVNLHGIDGSSFTLTAGGESVPVSMSLPGMYNVYNATAAAALGRLAGVRLEDIGRAIAGITPAFGRMERVVAGDRRIVLALAKNPAGMNEVLRTALQGGGQLHLLAMLNDNPADGRDVSWIWDADIEMLAGRVASVVFAGVRAPDLALRYKYAGVIDEDRDPCWDLDTDSAQALSRALDRTPVDGTLLVVPTYTALLDVRGQLRRLGYVKPYWES